MEIKTKVNVRQIHVRGWTKSRRLCRLPGLTGRAPHSRGEAGCATVARLKPKLTADVDPRRGDLGQLELVDAVLVAVVAHLR